MDATLILLVSFFLIALAGMAGIGIGVVIGLSIAGQEKTTEPQPAPNQPGSPPTESPSMSVESSVRHDTLVETVATSSPAALPVSVFPRAQRWSVVLAIAVILFCCLCSFLLAAMVTLGD